MEKNVQKNGFRSWIIIGAIVLLFLSFYKMNPNKDAVTKWTEVAFRNELAAQTVIPPVVRVVDYDAGTTYLTGEYASFGVDEKSSDKKTIKKHKYIVRLVPGENEDLMKFLASKSVPVEVEEKRSMLSPLMMNIIFMVGVGLFFLWMFSKRGAGAGIFEIGKSRAKILNGCENKCKTTFADIAGIDPVNRFNDKLAVEEFLNGSVALINGIIEQITVLLLNLKVVFCPVQCRLIVMLDTKFEAVHINLLNGRGKLRYFRLDGCLGHMLCFCILRGDGFSGSIPACRRAEKQ
jgi:hypothetical protein